MKTREDLISHAERGTGDGEASSKTAPGPRPTLNRSASDTWMEAVPSLVGRTEASRKLITVAAEGGQTSTEDVPAEGGPLDVGIGEGGLSMSTAAVVKGE